MQPFSSGTIKRVHRTHYIFEDDFCLVSFNPERTTVEQIFRREYTVCISGGGLNNPTPTRSGKIWVTESGLARSLGEN
jgi:hypothetical protein